MRALYQSGDGAKAAFQDPDGEKRDSYFSKGKKHKYPNPIAFTEAKRRLEYQLETLM